ncbi:hypothetical protein OG413_09295 [Streptomyces sp. NBC_01433]|uniref:hypothetical protein n=1 Tax=Streptomyces sp. NBC_01433 TaxID=2903864 RepID=UPI00225B8693|nr:hypothetical protein [Streptomyces sp. NBC_01433]MCX4675510.1 hypothetical protein [Streptomyces sp. NBC_01433]
MTMKLYAVDRYGGAVQVTRKEPTTPLPPLENLSDAQQRGTHCVWCTARLGTDLGIDLGEQRVIPATGAAYSWFPRECIDVLACAGRRAAR